MIIPSILLDSLEGVAGFNREAFLGVHEAQYSITSVRLNPSKPAPLKTLKIDEKVPWTSHGYYLQERPSFTLDPLFHAGCYYVQEASSMFLEEAMRQVVDLSKQLKVLDLCAAPGGKSTMIQSIITPDSLLVSNEVIKSRVNVLQENLIKWGGSNVVITNNDAKDFASLESFFDVVVVDAPCSGSGLFRKDPEAIGEWSLNNVQLCSQRQQRILADVIPSLKENGLLIYSTCSYSEEEDEAIVNWLIAEFEFELVKLNVRPDWNIIETNGYRFYPDKIKGEGFFLACLRKKHGDPSAFLPVKKTSKVKGERSKVKSWINDDPSIDLVNHKEDILAMPLVIAQDLPLLQKHLYIRQAGTVIGKLTSKELIPDHSLALSLIVSENIASVTLNKEQALQYLRKEEVLLDTEQKGWNLIKYEGHNLGWIKALPNRVNNYYPKEWRIFKR